MEMMRQIDKKEALMDINLRGKLLEKRDIGTYGTGIKWEEAEILLTPPSPDNLYNNLDEGQEVLVKMKVARVFAKAVGMEKYKEAIDIKDIVVILPQPEPKQEEIEVLSIEDYANFRENKIEGRIAVGRLLDKIVVEIKELKVK